MGQYTSYYLYQKFEKRDGQDFIPVYPNTYSVDADGTMPRVVKNENDENCGYIPPAPTEIYRWVQITPTSDPSTYVCDECPAEPMYRWVNVTPTSDPNSYWCDDCSSEYSGQYLTFVAVDSGTFTTPNNVYYSLDSGSTWTYLAASATTPTISAEQKIMWKQTGNRFYKQFSSTGRFNVEGNIMSLLYGDNFQNQTNLSGKDDAFDYLFSGSTGLTSAANLILPATTLSDSCYYGMFYGCSSLTSAPALPATVTTTDCYNHMFYGCASLVTAPPLPATTLAYMCYYHMFDGCSSLTTPPSVLPATEAVGQANYASMFAGCTSLTTTPAISATTLGNGTCELMFSGCTALTTPPVMNATTLGYRSCSYMFCDCTSLVTAPDLPATTLKEKCYYKMFYGCTSLNYVKCLATDISASNSTKYWLSNVASSGTFVKDSNTTWPSGASGIPSDWTVQNAT